MDNFYKLIFLVFLISYSSISKADSYPPVIKYQRGAVFYSTGQAACDPLNDLVPGIYFGSYGSQFGCLIPPGGGLYDYVSVINTCPGGGTYDYVSSCVGAPACSDYELRNSTTGLCELVSCPAGQILNTITHTCEAEAVCVPPESDNGFGLCAVRECASYAVLNQSTGQCQIKPTCAATEKYVNATNSCILADLACPGRTHANTANDQCLADAPLNCPIGMHDDGTYLCVANDAVRCSTDQTHGYIDGKPVCINKTQTADSNEEADRLDAEKKRLQAELEAAKARAAQTKAELDADPTNQTKIDANNAAQSDLATATNNVADAIAKLKNQYEEADHKNIKSIAEHIKDINEREIQAEKDGFGTIPSSDVIPTQSFNMPTIPTTSISSCPASRVISLHATSFSMSYQPYCDFAESVRPLVISMAYFAGALYLLGAFKD